ncbi:LmeA family phospholipid-binding protein [Streptacidiphilus rugosus]|uniref:LmeA family phospholipid-binding protein n=1 Tax=Streptacidiphilus rugosus TaxID=405783 RepID=UPI00055E7030|nr:DUF2993 domain-containing protein [Streptacidiphilus rugosus]
MRNLRRLLITLVILFGLFVAADRIAVRIAENQAASKIQSSRGLSQKPDVSIEGFPFLTQLIGSKLDEVKFHAVDFQVPAGKLQLMNLDADLHGVKISSDYSSAVADSATGTVTIRYSDLSAALPNHIKVTYGGSPGKVKVSGKIEGNTVTGTADISVSGGGSVKLGNLDTGDPLTSFLADVFAPEVPVSGLPSGLKLDSVDAEENGISVQASGTDVHLNG